MALWVQEISRGKAEQASDHREVMDHQVVKVQQEAVVLEDQQVHIPTLERVLVRGMVRGTLVWHEERDVHNELRSVVLAVEPVLPPSVAVGATRTHPGC